LVGFRLNLGGAPRILKPTGGLGGGVAQSIRYAVCNKVHRATVPCFCVYNHTNRNYMPYLVFSYEFTGIRGDANAFRLYAVHHTNRNYMPYLVFSCEFIGIRGDANAFRLYAVHHTNRNYIPYLVFSYEFISIRGDANAFRLYAVHPTNLGLSLSRQ
jgi:hypothetical protein